MRQDVYVISQFGMMFQNVFGSQGLHGKGQIHDFCRMTIASSQIDQAPFSQKIDNVSIGKFVSFDIVAGFKMAYCQGFQFRFVDFDIKMTGIGQTTPSFMFFICSPWMTSLSPVRITKISPKQPLLP